jgi:outer membrane protein assembly factor BamB
MGTLGLVALAVDWPLGGHDPGRSSAVPERISPPLEVTWSVTLHLEPEELVAAADTVIAAGSGAVVALDLGTGEEKWRYRVPGVRGSFRSCPAIWGDLVLVGGQLSDTLWALELATGEVSWRHPGFENLYADLCVSGDLLLVGDPSGLVALEASTGERVWQAEAVPAGSPAVAEGLVYALLWEETALAAFSLSTGEAAWRTDRAWGGSPSDPVVAGDLLAVVMGDRIRLWEKSSGTPRGEIALPHRQRSGKPSRPAAAGGKLFVPLAGEEVGWLVAVEVERQRVLWTRELPHWACSPCVVGDVVYLAAGSSLVALAAETGELLWERDFPGEASASPVAAAGAILCSFGDILYKLIPEG